MAAHVTPFRYQSRYHLGYDIHGIIWFSCADYVAHNAPMCHDYCNSMFTTEFSLHFDSSRIIHQMIRMVCQHHISAAHHLVANGYVSMSHIYFNTVVQCSSNLSPVGQSHLNKNKAVDAYAQIPNFRNIASSRKCWQVCFDLNVPPLNWWNRWSHHFRDEPRTFDNKHEITIKWAHE